MTRWLSAGLRLGITLLAFVWIFRLVDLPQLAAALRRADPRWLGLACLLYVAMFAACVVRWFLLLTSTHPIPFRLVLQWALLGAFFNTLLPTTIGGDVVRIHEASRPLGDWARATATVLLDRLAGFLALFVIGVVAAIVALPRLTHPVLVNGLAALVALFTLAVVGLASRRGYEWLTAPLRWLRLTRWHDAAQRFYTLLQTYRQYRRALAWALLLSLFVQAGAIGMYWLVAQAMALPAPLWAIWLFVPILMLIAMLPISLNGLGIREGAAMLLLGTVGVPQADALGWSLVGAVIPALSGLAGAVIFVQYRRKNLLPDAKL